MEIVLSLSHFFSVLALQYFAQTTAVIVAGLLLCLLISNRMPLLQNLLCRWTLVALLFAPVAVLVIQNTPTPRYSVILPLDTAILEQAAPVALESSLQPTTPASLTVAENNPDIQAYSTGAEDMAGQHDPAPSETAPEIQYSPIETRVPQVNTFLRHVWIMYLAITLVWALLIVLGIIRLINSFSKLSFIIQTAIPAESELQQLIKTHAHSMNTVFPDVFRSPFAHSPFLCGIRRPVIIVPDHLAITDDIILHELVHLKRHDVIWSLAGQIVSIVFPIQPLVRFLVSIMEDTNDLICDRFVVEQLRNPRKYAMRLVSLTALLCPGNPKDTMGLGLLPSRKSLKFRIISILEFDPNRTTPFRKHLLSLGAAGIIACSLLSGYIEVQGVETSSMFTRFMFINSMKYMPGAKHIVQAAQAIVHGEDNTSAERPAPPSQRSGGETAPLPVFDAVRNSAINSMNTLESSQRIVEAEAIEQASKDYEDELVVHESHSAPIELSEVTVEEYVAGYDVLAEMTNRGLPVSAGTAAMPMDIGIPGAPLVLAQFSAAKQVNVTCDYDMSSLTPTSTKEEVAELEYLRSLDKNKQEVAWSPDGVTLAFTDNNRIWLVSIEGGDPVLVYEYKQNGHLVDAISDLCFTPDGSEIIFTKKNYDPALGSVITIMEYSGGVTYVSFSNPIPNIESINLETGEHQILVEEAYMGTLSCDGSLLYFLRFDPDFYQNKPDKLHNLPMILDLETGKSMLLTTIPQRYGRPTFSPDDSYIMLPCYNFGHPEQLYRLDLSGGDPVPVTTYEFPALTGRNIRTPSFDPTGRWILYNDATWHNDGPDNSLWVYSVLTGKKYPLFEDCQYDQMGASWNNDGTKFCFIRVVDNINYLYMIDFIVPEAEKKIASEMDKPIVFELDQNYPNPFNMQTTIDFTIPESGDVTFMLYSITGQKVRTLVDSRLDAGRHSVVWDGRDDNGAEAASGTYLSRLICNNGSRQGKMTLIK